LTFKAKMACFPTPPSPLFDASAPENPLECLDVTYPAKPEG